MRYGIKDYRRISAVKWTKVGARRKFRHELWERTQTGEKVQFASFEIDGLRSYYHKVDSFKEANRMALDLSREDLANL